MRNDSRKRGIRVQLTGKACLGILFTLDLIRNSLLTQKRRQWTFHLEELKNSRILQIFERQLHGIFNTYSAST